MSDLPITGGYVGICYVRVNGLRLRTYSDNYSLDSFTHSHSHSHLFVGSCYARCEAANAFTHTRKPRRRRHRQQLGVKRLAQGPFHKPGTFII